jgi:hypothetical protein
MPRNPNKTPCQVPDCTAWAMRDSHPALCASHAGRTTGAGAPNGNQNRRTRGRSHGFYASIRNLIPLSCSGLIPPSCSGLIRDQPAPRQASSVPLAAHRGSRPSRSPSRVTDQLGARETPRADPPFLLRADP